MPRRYAESCGWKFFVRPIGKCVLRVRINNRELPFEFCSHDVILGWDFLEASQAVIDCGQNELVLEDICRDSHSA
ncbi:transposon Ty3-I Gag-Pol polyprotein [Trichonephila clavipes]|nr:transposon Ty3-I Gag-Pol polyprotein [Trichonephila clavipes]